MTAIGQQMRLLRRIPLLGHVNRKPELILTAHRVPNQRITFKPKVLNQSLSVTREVFNPIATRRRT